MSLIICFSVLIIDQFTKYVVLQNLPLGVSHTVVPFLNLVHARNTGVSFSLLSSFNMRWWLVGLTVLILVYVIRLWQQSNIMHHRIAYAAVIGGALGNMVDRTIHGSVIDFLFFHWKDYCYPAFNVADIAIVCGVGWLLLRGYDNQHTS